jgi:Flp pilus assembly protein CpaB
MAPSTLAGTINAIATVFVALIGAGATVVVALILRKTQSVEKSVDRANGQIAEVHVLVDGASKRLQTLVVSQQQHIITLEDFMLKRGLSIPATETTAGEPIVATALLDPGEALQSGKPPEAQGGSDVE